MKPYPRARTKAMKHPVSPDLHNDLRQKPDLVILHTDTNDLKSVSSPKEIANEIISLALYANENDQQIAFGNYFPRR